MGQNKLLTKECLEWVKGRYLKKYSNFEDALAGYEKLKPFNPDGNIWESGQTINEQEHYFMRLVSQYYLTKTFEAMMINMENPNVSEDLENGANSTPYRIIKVWNGASIDDDTELGGGRWNKPIRIASFPNENKDKKIPITKRVDFTNTCSHHFLPMTTTLRDDSYAFISYIPADRVLGISKLQRLVNSCKAFVLQEDVTKNIWTKVSEAAETESVYVKIVNAVHMCEKLRGSQSDDGAFSSEYYGGLFEDSNLRAQVDRSV